MQDNKNHHPYDKKGQHNKKKHNEKEQDNNPSEKILEKTLRNAAKSCLINNLNLKSHESLLIITDRSPEQREIGNVFFEESAKITEEAALIVMSPRKVDGEEPPKAISAAMLECDAIITPTKRSLSHTKARKKATENNARVISMPGITREMMARAFFADYRMIKKRCNILADILDKGKEVRILSPSGTDIVLSIKGRKAFGRSGGMYYGKSEDKSDFFGNMPAGEAYIAPVEGSANGVYVIDTGSPLGGLLKENIIIKVKDGFAKEISGGTQAEELLRELRRIGDNDAFNIAELGIGTNPSAKITGKVLEDEKAYGTAHIALGNNKGFGGRVSVPMHLDGVFIKPTIYVDGQKIMEEGVMIEK